MGEICGEREGNDNEVRVFSVNEARKILEKLKGKLSDMVIEVGSSGGRWYMLSDVAIIVGG